MKSDQPTDFLIIGAGFSGLVIAERLSAAGWKCVVVDRRNHLGGNARDATDAAGVKTWFDLERLEGGDDYDRKIQRNIARCSFFIPIVSATTQRRLEGYFRREWSYAIDRARNIADGAVFILPVCVDDTNEGAAQVPDKFRAVHFTRLAGGEVSPAFLEQYLSVARRVAHLAVGEPKPKLASADR